MTIAEQRAAALDAANQVRIDRAKLRLRVGAGEVAAWKVIEHPPACIAKVTVFDFLTWMPGIGTARGSAAFRLLRKARVASHTRLGELTPSQRGRLVTAVHEYKEPPTNGGPSLRRDLLTDRQLHIMQMAATGAPRSVMAQAAGVTMPAIRDHLSRAFRKLGVTNRTAAVWRCLELGLIDPPAKDENAKHPAERGLS